MLVEPKAMPLCGFAENINAILVSLLVPVNAYSLINYLCRKRIGIYGETGRNYTDEWYQKYIISILSFNYIVLVGVILRYNDFTKMVKVLCLSIPISICITLGKAYLSIVQPHKYGINGLPYYVNMLKDPPPGKKGPSFEKYCVQISILYTTMGIISYFVMKNFHFDLFNK